MKILFVDDMKERHAKAIQQYSPHHVVISAYTANEAIKLMNEQFFEIICLDHDLGESIFSEESPGSGSQIALWMVKSLPNHKWPHQVVLHSVNPFGRKYMFDLLRDAGFDVIEKPFTMW